jgi:hypothetical protein
MLHDVIALFLEIPDVKLDGLDPHSDFSSDCAEVVEVSALEHFSAILQEAQRLAVQAERDKATQKQPRSVIGKLA